MWIRATGLGVIGLSVSTPLRFFGVKGGCGVGFRVVGIGAWGLREEGGECLGNGRESNLSGPR